MDNDLIIKLKERGIYDTVIKHGWEQHDAFGGRGWAYPVYLSNGSIIPDGKRWKKADSTCTRKYSWLPSQPDKARYYMLPGALEAIQATKTVYIASGEPDNLVFHSAGTHNVLSWYGEKSMPDTFIEDMKRLGVETIFTYPDTDNTGLLFAAKLNQIADGHFETFILKLPYEFKDSHGDDINQLWIDCKFNVIEFNKTREALNEIPLADYAMYIPSDLPTSTAMNLDTILPPAFLQAIATALGVDGYKADGWSRKLFSCPFHDDKTPSASWHQDGVLKCFSECGRNYNAKETGERLNIYLRDFLPQSDYHAPTSQVQASGEPEVEPAPSEYLTDQHRDDKVLAQLTEMVFGRAKITERSFDFPLIGIRKFGGLAAVCTTSKVTLFAGASGDGKTMLLEFINDMLNNDAYDGMFWGKEWTRLEMMMRRIQRYSGITKPELQLTYTMLNRHNTWYGNKQHGIKDSDNRGVLMSQAQLEEYKRTVNYLNTWRGHTDWHGAQDTLEDTCMDMTANIQRARHEGRDIMYAIFDYAQLIQTRSWDNTVNRFEYAFDQVKKIAFDLNIHIFMTTQVNKQKSTEYRSGQTMLDMDSANYIRPDKANLFLALNRQFYKHNGEMIPTLAYWLNIAKASIRDGDEMVKPSDLRAPIVMQPLRLQFAEKDWTQTNGDPFNRLKDNRFCAKDGIADYQTNEHLIDDIPA